MPLQLFADVRQGATKEPPPSALIIFSIVNLSFNFPFYFRSNVSLHGQLMLCRILLLVLPQACTRSFISFRSARICNISLHCAAHSDDGSKVCARAHFSWGSRKSGVTHTLLPRPDAHAFWRSTLSEREWASTFCPLENGMEQFSTGSSAFR